MVSDPGPAGRNAGAGLPGVRLLALTLLLLLPGVPSPAQPGAFNDSTLLRRLRLFAPATLSADTARLGDGERRALSELVAAAKVVERIYLLQAWAGNPALLDSLAADTTGSGKLRLRYFMINMSPWSAADRSSAFLGGVPEKRPPQANFYPQGMRRSEWGPWFIRLDARRQAEALGPYNVIRRDSAGGMKTVPYSVEYRDLLAEAGSHLKAAATLTGNAGTRSYLTALTGAFGNDDYSGSNLAALTADGPITVVIGPTNGSLDGIFNYKRAFEAVIGIRNDSATRQLRLMEAALAKSAQSPAESGAATTARPTKRVALRIDDALFIGGGARADAVASTLRLPGDTSAGIAADGKTILLRNVHERKFRLIQAPIAAAVFDSAVSNEVTFDAFFLTLMMHELRHRYDHVPVVSPSDDPAAANNLIDPIPALLEVAADLGALDALDRMLSRDQFGNLTPRALRLTHVSTLLRALRFWDTDPVTAGSAMQFNYLADQGAITYDPAGGVVRIDVTKMNEAFGRLSTLVSAALTEGNGPKSQAFYAKYAQQPVDLTRLRERLADIPYDLEPRFPLFE